MDSIVKIVRQFNSDLARNDMYKYDVVIYSRNEKVGWHDPCSAGSLFEYLSKASSIKGRGKVMVVERPVSLLPQLLLEPINFIKRMFNGGVRKLAENLYVFTPLVPVRMGAISHSETLLKAARRQLSKQLIKALSNLDFISPSRVSVVSEPFHWRMLKLVEEDIMVYDCSDDYTKLSPNSKIGKTCNDEAKLAAQVHLCFATAKSLSDKLSQYNKNVHYIPNGVDIDLYCNDRSLLDIPQDIGSIAHPIIGFMGNLNHWYDLDLIFKIASIKKSWNFVFVGTTGSGIENGISSLRSLPNCHFLGWKDHLFLPTYLKCFDAAIMPYKTGDLTETINPGKMYQYMASGLSIVSTPIPEVLGYKDLIEIASTPQDFIEAFNKIFKSGFGCKKERLVEEAKKHSWAQRAKQKDILIENELEKMLQANT